MDVSRVKGNFAAIFAILRVFSSRAASDAVAGALPSATYPVLSVNDPSGHKMRFLSAGTTFEGILPNSTNFLCAFASICVFGIVRFTVPVTAEVSSFTSWTKDVRLPSTTSLSPFLNSSDVKVSDKTCSKDFPSALFPSFSICTLICLIDSSSLSMSAL